LSVPILLEAPPARIKASIPERDYPVNLENPEILYENAEILYLGRRRFVNDQVYPLRRF
jgi:hypothetical protein